MTVSQIEENVKNIVKNFSREEFIFDLLLAYGNPRATITRLKAGDRNKLETKGEFEQPRKLFFNFVEKDLYSTIDQIKNSLKKKRTDPRFIVVIGSGLAF